jgi:hypothetical protein
VSYTINLTNGTTLVPGGLSEGTYDNSHTSLILIGKNYAGYGQFLNTNFVHLLENFANTSSPANPLKGQLWWDTRNNILKVYSGQSWKISTGATSSPANQPPGDLSTLGGDLWFDTTNAQLKVYSGTQWVVVGPAATAATGDTGAFPVLMPDTLGASHLAIQLRFSGVVYALFSKDTFTQNVIDGFPTVKAGLNFSTVASPTWGISTQDVLATQNTLVLRDGAGGINATTVTAGGINAGSLTALSMSGNIVVPSTSTFTANGYSTYNGYELATIGGGAQFSSINNTIIGNSSPAAGTFTTITTTGTAGVSLSLGGIKPSANITGNVGSSTNYFNNTFSNNVVVLTGIIPTSNMAANIGSSGAWFNTFFGKSVQAQYADLAERFEADAAYDPGTVVEIGGPAEVTAVGQDLSENVFGVISTNAAYLMNSGAGSDETHPPIAVQGRVPVKVTGKIRKGDRLVSAGNGIARAGSKSEINTWNVIGRALENKTTDGVGTIEAVVKLNS